MILGQPESSGASSYFLDLLFYFGQDIVFEERHYGVHPAGTYPGLMDTSCVLHHFACPAQVFNEDNPRELSHRGGSERGQRVCVGVATSGNV